MEFKPPDNIFWLCSSAAQAIAAFVGFLTAGYYFVLQTMEMRLSRDSSLEEIYSEIKVEQYNELRTLLIYTGITILGSLLMVYLNAYDFLINKFLIVIVALLIILTIIAAIKFVISIVNPKTFSIVTNKLIEQDNYILDSESSDTIKYDDFIKQFIELEKLLPIIFEKFNIRYASNYSNKNFISVREAIEILYRKELIDKDTRIKFLEVNKIRNLAVHGKVDFVNKDISLALKQILDKLNSLNKPLEFKNMEELEAKLSLFSPRWGHDDIYTLDLKKDSLVFSIGPRKSVCYWNDNIETIWSGDKLTTILENNHIYPPVIFPKLLEHIWLSWRNGEIDKEALNNELKKLSDWLNSNSNTKPNSDFWAKYF